MKKGFRVICKAYENWNGAQIKKEIANCGNDKEAIAYAAKFIEGLNAENAVMIRFTNEDADVEYVIDADKLENANLKISAMASAYENVDDNDGEEKAVVKFEVGTTYGGDTLTAKVTKRTAKKITFLVCFTGNPYHYFKGLKMHFETKLVSKIRTLFNACLESSVEYIELKNPLNSGLITFYANEAPYKFNNVEMVDVEDDGSNDDADEEDNFDVKDDDDEWVDEAEEVSVEEKVITTAELENELEEVHDLIDGNEMDICRFSQEIRESFSEIRDAENRLLENLFDQYELKRKKIKIEALIEKLTTKLEVVNVFLDHLEWCIVSDKADIKSAKSGIANMEDSILYRGVEIYELGKKAAALDVEIFNRKIAESCLDSIVETVVEPVTFEIERFNDGVIADDVATIDTAVSATEIPIIDEDSENDSSSGKYAELEDELNAKLAAIKKLQDEVKELRGKLKDIDSDCDVAMGWADEKLRKLGSKKIELTDQDGKKTYNWQKPSICIFNQSGKFSLSLAWGTETWLAFYSSIKTFKAAICELAAAVERGDTEFTFPADSENAD